MTPYDAPPAVPAALVVSNTDDELLAAVAARGETTAKPATNGPLIATVLLFLALGGLSWGWTSVVFLTLAIALHEIGHVLAMRIFGYKNVRLLFVPLFGGLATGEPRELDATKNALVALAGPVFGLVTAALAGVIAYFLDSPPWLVKFAWLSLGLNAFNLVPFVPLDGGQVANESLFSRYPILELIFRLIAIAGLGWFAWTSRAWVLGLLVVFMLLGTPMAYRRARLVRDARRDPAWQTRPLDRESVGLLRAMVTAQFRGVAAQKYEKNLPALVHGMWLGIHKRFPGPGQTAALLAAYTFTCVIAVPALAFFLARCLERPVF